MAVAEAVAVLHCHALSCAGLRTRALLASSFRGTFMMALRIKQSTTAGTEALQRLRRASKWRLSKVPRQAKFVMI